MATATSAPELSAAKQRQFQPVRKIEPKEYIFRLKEEWMKEYRKREDPNCGRFMLAMQDDIYWPYLIEEDGSSRPAGIDESIQGKEIEYLPRSIRYISSAYTIFLDEQERTGVYKIEDGRNRLLDNPLNRDKLIFQNGEIRVPSNDKTLKNYLHCMNQCKNQNPKANDNGRKAKMLNTEFEMLDFAYGDLSAVELGAKKEKAYELAKTARKEEMLPHAKYLNISFSQEGSSEEKSPDRIRQDYVDYAYNNAEMFLKTFDDPRVKITYQINQLLDSHKVTFNKVHGQAHWSETGAFITNLPPDQNPVAFLAGFALSKEGTEFHNNMRAFK